MIKKTVQDINEYVGTTVNPLNSPDTMYELYSVPSYDTDYPEVLLGSEIGSSKVTVEENDVLVCKINPRINRVWVVKHRTEHQLIASSEWVIIRSPENDARYLRYYFQSPTFRTYINSGLTGIGGSLTRAQPKQIAKYPVPIPDIEIQHDIADTLDKLQSIITHRKQQLAKLDELVKARFVEMFGSISNNKFGYEVMTLQDVCKPIKDGTHQTPTYTEDTINGYKFLSSKDVTSGKVDWNHLKYIPEELHNELYKRISPSKGDILLAKNGTTGVAAIVDRDEVFDIYVSLALLRPLGMVTSEYLCAAVNSIETKHQFDSNLKGIGVPNLHLGEIKKTKIVVPPIEAQEKFADFVKQVDKSKVAVQKALDEAQLLFDSLMQEYFG